MYLIALIKYEQWLVGVKLRSEFLVITNSNAFWNAKFDNDYYTYSYETGNGIKREETSYDKIVPKVEGRSADSSNEGGESDEIHVQQGSYSYTAPDGTVVSVR